MLNTIVSKAWSSSPLCCRYFCAYFVAQRCRVRIDRTSVESTVAWAIGVLSDGDWEVLGIWPGSACGPEIWPDVFDNLRERGVEGISVVFTNQMTGVFSESPGLSLTPPSEGRSLMGTPVRSSSSGIEAFQVLQPQGRALVCKGARIMEQLSRSVSYAVRRHGSFGDFSNATSCVSKSLARVERRVRMASIAIRIPAPTSDGTFRWRTGHA